MPFGGSDTVRRYSIRIELEMNKDWKKKDLSGDDKSYSRTEQFGSGQQFYQASWFHSKSQ